MTWIALLCAACSGRANDDQQASRPAPEIEAPKPKPHVKKDPHEEPLFALPDDRARFAAAGNRAMLSDELSRAFSGDGFSPMAEVEAGDWLAEHHEPGQTYDQFVAGRYQRPTEERRTIYVLQIGALESDRTPPLPVLVDFLEAYFQLPVKVLPQIAPKDLKVSHRDRTTGVQLHAGEILEALRERLPNDAFCLIALTELDLYPQDDWNFVFGMAKLRQRVGVYSFARYHPGFYSKEYEGYNFDTLILDRSLKIMAHEVGHMFGLEHCIYYECVINGSNSMGETDKSPSHLCPVDLRKLHYSIRFDPIKRYRDLEAFYKRQHFAGHAAFVRARRLAIETTED